MKKKRLSPPIYSGYWVDWFMPRLAHAFLPWFLKVSWLTPNIISALSFFIFLVGCVLIFLPFTFHLQAAGICLPLSYFFDCLDGQVARVRKMSSPFGAYLDRVLDIFKLFFLTVSLSLFAFLQTHNALYIFLGTIALFSIVARFYIKYIAMFSCIDRDGEYLHKSSLVMAKIDDFFYLHYAQLSQSLSGNIQKFAERMLTLFFVDEGEYVFIAALGLLIKQVPLSLYVLAITQLTWVIIRAVQRGYQIQTTLKILYEPLRK